MNSIPYILLAASMMAAACSPEDKPAPDTDSQEYNPKLEAQIVVNNTRGTKTLNAFDEMFSPFDGVHYNKTSNLRYAVSKERRMGEGAYELTYSFKGGADPEKPEYAAFQEFCGDYRADLSFYPLGLSIWVKGSERNKGTFRFVLMEDEKMFSEDKPADPSHARWRYYAFEDDEIISKEGWHKLVMPYKGFRLLKDGEGSAAKEPMLNRFAGYSIEIVNKEGQPSEGRIYVDELKQLTSFDLEPNKAKFNSIFVQLHVPEYEGTDWDKEFRDSKAIGIDTWIVQYAQQYEKYISFYKNTSLPWVSDKKDYIDRMFAAAERQGIQLIIGLYPGRYTRYNYATEERFQELETKDNQVFDELLEQFGNHPCLAGWYITEEFHDGQGPWLQFGNSWAPGLDRLAQYMEAVASHIKSKSDKPVCISPALWRGLPADLCGKWFERFFQTAKSIDFLYLQDCGGRNRGSYYLTDPDVDLPNWYAEIKKACDRTGVVFGVDIESFKANYRGKTWDEIKEQLWSAGMYTEYITNFSWATFKKGTDGYAGYQEYLKENNLL